MEQQLAKKYNEIICTKTNLAHDFLHNRKRVLSFEYLDLFIGNCQKEICPAFSDNVQKIRHCLIDISIESYLQQRAYFYSLDNIGNDDIDRFLLANSRVNTIFRCKKEPSISENVFYYDNQDLLNPTVNCIKNRKAYWTYLKYKPNNNSFTDYCGASRFIEEICSFNNNGKNNGLDSCELFLRNNFHIANGLDLYRYCLLRKSTLIDKSKLI